jgi:enoyl-CoA hydratase/carnithine racemase
MPLDQRVPSLTFDGGVTTLWFDRPEKRNALNLATWSALPVLIAEAVAQAPTRVILIRGKQGDFAAGADIAEFDTVFADRGATLSYLDLMQAATAAIEASPVPVIAVVEGLCIGAGVAIAAACDLRLASKDAQFAITPARLGLVYSRTDTRRIVDLIGGSAAKDLLFTGRMIDADAALAFGLVNAVHENEALESAVVNTAMLIAANSSWSHVRSKNIVASIQLGMRDDDAETRGWFADAPEGPDYREGVTAFRVRRPPEFAPRQTGEARQEPL